MEYMIKMVNIDKHFGEVLALDNVNFEVGRNEIVGLVGDNGAGKSTLIKIINGFHSPTKGKVYVFGEEVKHFTVEKAREMGIETVYQEKALIDQHSVWRNVFLGREIGKVIGFMDIGKMKEETTRLMRDFMGFTSTAFDYSTLVRTMSGGERQGVSIARSLYFDARLIILDEPTMSLSLSETRKVLDFVKKIKASGKSCIFIDHNIYHVYPAVDRIVVLDRGKVAGTFNKEEISLHDLVEKLQLVARTGKLDNNKN
jgi:simple sugar transport system ATP-binding protein